MNRVTTTGSFAIACLAACTGCTGDGGVSFFQPPDDGTIRVMLGPAGGVARGGGLALGMPPGALTENVLVTIGPESMGTTDATGAVGPVIRFEPAGLHFAQPVLINIDVPAGVYGRLYWSRDGDETMLDPIGFAADGKARAWVSHFSVGAVATDGCTITPGPQDCACRARDTLTQLCVASPPDECFADNGWAGQPGNDCSGYGLRDEVTIRCRCMGAGQRLCPVPHDLPVETCPGDKAAFIGETGGSCSGYYVERDPVTGMSFSRITGGTLYECNPVVDGQVWRLVGGQLVDCTPRPEPTTPPPGEYSTWAFGTEDTVLEEPTIEDTLPGVTCAPPTPLVHPERMPPPR